MGSSLHRHGGHDNGRMVPVHTDDDRIARYRSLLGAKELTTEAS
ncbi:MAG: hypothetical protein ACRDS9_10775 [Pseudonocardiaceae bacterium]